MYYNVMFGENMSSTAFNNDPTGKKTQQSNSYIVEKIKSLPKVT